MPADPQRIQAIFLAAAEHSDPARRAALLARECGEDLDLRRRVEELLLAHDQPQSFLERPAAPYLPTIAEGPVSQAPGMVIDPYKLLQQIGEGGMGTVYMAEQTHPVQRKVALKLIRPGLDNRQVIARFEAERQALALMDHPHIARVLDAGTTESGQPYFVMELVHGVAITKYCDQHRLTPRQRLELFVPVCQAIQHAHQKGIIHRDIKPSNVMVTLYDGKPVPKVIDFGVAKAVGQKLTESTLFTEFGSIVGTLEYMSPEQAEQNQFDIDTRSDIYSLGVLLYELLTGTTPLDKKHLRGAAILEMLRIIKEDEPQRPSMRLSTTDELPSIAANRSLEPKKLSGLVRGELDWIVMKALEKDRNRRYETANGFAMDVQRYLADEPVLACPPSMSYRFRKLARRNKVALSFAGLVTAAMVLGMALLAFSNARIRTESQAKEQALIEADENFQTARDAVDRMYTRAAEEMRDKPQMEQIRRALLEDALRFYQRFLKRKSEDPTVRYEAALSQRRVGEIYGFLDDWNASLEHHRESTKMLVSLLPQFANDVHYRDEVARSHFHSGRALMALLELDEGTRSLEEAITLWEALTKEFPEKPSYLEDLADANFMLGRGWCRNYYAKGPPYITRGQELLTRLRQTFPGHEISSSFKYDLREITAWRYLHLPHDPAILKQLERDCRDNLALAEAEARKNPEIPRYELAVVDCLGQLGNVLLALDRFEELEQISLRSMEIRQRQGMQYPDSPQFQLDLAWSHYHRAWLLQISDRPDEALVHFRTAISIISDLASKLPNNRRLLAHHAEMLRGCPVPQLRDPQRVLEICTRLKDLGQEGWEDLASAQVEVGMYQEALESCRKSSLGGRPSPIVAYVTALAYWHLGRHAEARELAQHVVLQLGSQPNEYWYHGECRWRARELAGLMGIDTGGLKSSDPEKALRTGIALYRKLAAKQPEDPRLQQELAVRYSELFQLLSVAGRTEEADRIFGEGLDVWRKRAKVHAATPDQALQLVDQLINIGHSLHWVRPQESLRVLTETLPLARQLLAAFPDVRGCREQIVRSGTLLAWVMLDTQQPEKAEELARQSLESAAQLVKEFGGESKVQAAFALAAKVTGQALAANGRGDEAERVFHQGLDTLVSIAPGDHSYHRELFGIQIDLYKLLAKDSSRLQEAEDFVRAAITSREKWITEVPGDAGDRAHLGWAYRYLGAVLARQPNRDPEADAASLRDISIFEQLSTDFPNDLHYRAHLVYARDIWQRRLSDTGRPREAAQALDQDLDERRKLVKDFPSVPEYRLQLVDLLITKGRSSQAEEPFRQALTVYMQLALDQPNNLDYRLRLSRCYNELAGMFARQGKPAEGALEWDKAAAEYSKAIELKPEASEAWSGRAFAHFGRQQWDAAIADFSRAIELAPLESTNWWHRGHCYLNLAQWDKSAADFGTVVNRWPDGDTGEGWYLRAVSLAQLNQPENAVADLRQAIAKGFRHVGWMKNDSRLDPLRTREDFGKLLEELEQKEKSQSQ